MQESNDVKYFVATELGKHLPFAIVDSKLLLSSDDIFTPSLRDFHVIFWVKKGQGSFSVDFKDYPFDEGSLILLSKDQLHYFHPFDKSKTEIISIGFTPEFLYKKDSDLEHLFKFNANAHQANKQTIRIPNPIVNRLEALTNEMFKIYGDWPEAYREKGFYHQLCLFLIQCEMLLMEKEDQSKSNENISDFLVFNDLLEKHYKSEFKVEFYANKLNMTVKSLSKLTKLHYKLSPKSVIDNRRLLELKRQLQGTSKSGKTIAYELNFGEPTNMFKFFKKHMGITPNEFRSQFQ